MLCKRLSIALVLEETSARGDKRSREQLTSTTCPSGVNSHSRNLGSELFCHTYLTYAPVRLSSSWEVVCVAVDQQHPVAQNWLVCHTVAGAVAGLCRRNLLVAGVAIVAVDKVDRLKTGDRNNVLATVQRYASGG